MTSDNPQSTDDALDAILEELVWNDLPYEDDEGIDYGYVRKARTKAALKQLLAKRYIQGRIDQSKALEEIARTGQDIHFEAITASLATLQNQQNESSDD